MIRTQQKSVAHEHEVAFGGLHGIGDIAFRLGFFHHSHRNIRARDSVSLNLHAGIPGLKGFNHGLVRFAGEGGVPSNFALGLRAVVQNLFAISSVIGYQLGNGHWLPALQPSLRRQQEQHAKHNREGAHHYRSAVWWNNPTFHFWEISLSSFSHLILSFSNCSSVLPKPGCQRLNGHSCDGWPYWNFSSTLRASVPRRKSTKRAAPCGCGGWAGRAKQPRFVVNCPSGTHLIEDPCSAETVAWLR